MLDLSGKTAVITGGSGSFGYAIGKSLYYAGSNVILIGRSSEKLKSAVKDVNKSSGVTFTYEKSDITSEDSLLVSKDKIINQFKKIDILVTCAAGAAASGKFEDITSNEWKNLLSTDLDGVFLACKVFGSEMVKNKFGRIINFTSFHNVATYPYRTAYNTAKSGVEGLSRALAVEWGHHNITVNTIAPGPILTPRTEWFLNQDERNPKGMLSRTPNVRIGDLDDITSSVLFLASNEAKHINGQRLVIDGGWTKNSWWGDHQELD